MVRWSVVLVLFCTNSKSTMCTAIMDKSVPNTFILHSFDLQKWCPANCTRHSFYSQNDRDWIVDAIGGGWWWSGFCDYVYFFLLRASSESCVVCRNDTCFKYDDDDDYSIAIIQRVLQVPSSNMTTMMMRILSWSSTERHARTISSKSPRDSTAPLPPLVK